MTVESLQSAALASAEHAFARVLLQAGVSPQHLIHVAGPGSLPAMLWLCRQGYDKAIHQQPEAPRCGLEPADALLIPHLSDPADLAGLLHRAEVRPGGVLIVRTGARFQAGEALAGVAASLGYGLEKQLADKGHAFFVARRTAAAPARKVA